MIARFDQGRLPVRLAPWRWTNVLADVRERFAVRSRETDRPLIAESPDGLSVTADPERLRQALGNMVDNAFRHGQGTVRISRERVERPGGAARQRRGSRVPERLPGCGVRALHSRRRGPRPGRHRAGAGDRGCDRERPPREGGRLQPARGRRRRVARAADHAQPDTRRRGPKRVYPAFCRERYISGPHGRSRSHC